MTRDSTGGSAGTGLHRTAPRWIMVGAVLYLAWILEGLLLTSDLDPASSYISELSARDQAGSVLYRTTDALAGAGVAAGAFLAAFSPRLLRLIPRRIRVFWRVMWWSLLVFGLATVADAAFPMECAITGDAACTAAEMADELPWTHTVHTVTSTVATAALLVAVVVAMPVARRAGWHYGALVIAAGLLTGVGSVWLGVEMGRPYLPVAPPWEPMIGAAQRIQIVAAALWLMRIARLLRLFIADSAFVTRAVADDAWQVGEALGEVDDRGNESGASAARSEDARTTAVAGVDVPGSDVAGVHVAKHDAASGTTTGVPLVLCAGLGLSLRVWRPVQSYLAHRPTVAAARGRGHGRATVTLESAMAELSSAVDEGAPGRVVLVAHSMWGPVVEGWARRYPERVAGLVLVDSSVEEKLEPQGGRRPLAAWVADVADRLHLPRAGRLLRELAGYRGVLADLERVRQDRPLPDVPVLVVGADRGALRADRSWIARQQGLAARLRSDHPRGAAAVRVEIVVPSSHLVMLDRPATLAALVETLPSAPPVGASPSTVGDSPAPRRIDPRGAGHDG